MSIAKNIREIPIQLREKASKDLCIDISGNNKYTRVKKYMNVYQVQEAIGYFPYYYAKNTLGLSTKLRSKYPPANIRYKNEEYPLREEQVKVKSKAISYLNKNGTCILAIYPGFGKTCLSIYLAAKLKLKTLYINNRLTILDQIVDSVTKFSHSKVQLLHPKTVIDPSADFYVVNGINVPKFPPGTFANIGTLIVDEIHMMLSEILSRCLYHVTPRYLIGLSATPYREDGLDSLFNLYFGEEKIHIPLFRKHMVYKIETPIKPTIEYTDAGTVNWGTVLNDQATSVERNEKILKIFQKFKDRVFIVICKRVEQIKYLEKRLEEEGESFSALYGSKKKYDKEARILVGTTQKLGTGFDHPRINALLLAGDVESYYVQTLGRSMRTPEVDPIIFDLVDKNSSLKKHYKTRERVYIEHGGNIKGMDWKTLEEVDIGQQSLLESAPRRKGKGKARESTATAILL